MKLSPPTRIHLHVGVRLCCIIASMLGITLSASADINVLRDQWLARDPRLQRPVTITRQHIRIGELLQEAARQTRVPLASNHFDSGDSVVLTVYARKIPLVDLLADVWSMVSYQQAAWEWEVDGDGTKKPYSYRLDCPEKAQHFPVTIRGEVNKDFVGTMQASIEALDASPERIASLEKQFPDVTFLRDPLSAAKTRAFASLFPADERVKLAEGKIADPVTIPSSRWTPEMDSYADASIAFLKSQSAKSGIAIDASYPDKVTAYREYIPGELTPTLWFTAGNAGWPVIGSTSMEAYWRKRLEARWVMDGDELTDSSHEAQIVPAEPAPPKLPYRLMLDIPTYHQLNDLNLLTGIPIIARDVEDFHFQPIYTKSFGDIIKDFRSGQQSVKWRNGSLLISQNNWIRHAIEDADKQVPWQTMKHFRDQLIATGNYSASLGDFARLAYDLTPRQLKALGDAEDLVAPNMFIQTSRVCAEIAELRPLLAPLAVRDELLANIQSPSGIRVRELPKEMQDFLATKTPGEISSDIRVRIRKDMVTPEAYPLQWRGWSPKGLTFGYIYYFELGTPDDLKTIGKIDWDARDVAVLNEGRKDLEADLKMTTFKVYGEPDIRSFHGQ